MKTFFAKLKAWITGHKVVSIIIASVLTVGIACSIILPIALKHEHEYATTYSTDATNHWYECECGEKKDIAAHQASAVYSSDETNHWKECSACGYDLSIEAHSYNQEVATNDYLKTAATALTKAVYYKSCVCGKAGTETFETDKTIATLTNIVMSGKVYDGTAVVAPTFDKNSDGSVTIEYSVKDANAFTTTAPIDAGEYTVRITVAETETYTGAVATEDFTISQKVININAFYSFEYAQSSHYWELIPPSELVERDQALALYFDFYFVGWDAGAEIERIEISNDADQVNPNYAVGEQIGAEIIKKGLAGSSAHLDVHYGDLIEDLDTAGKYYYDYVLTAEDDYGLVGEDTVTIRFYYSSADAGTLPDNFEIIDSNNYYDEDMGFNNSRVSAKVLEFPELIISLCNGNGTVVYEFPENELGEEVSVMFTAKNGADDVDCSGRYWGIKSAEDFQFFVNNQETENYCFEVSGDDYLNLFFIGETISFTNDVAGQSSNSISMEDFPKGGLFPLIVQGGMYQVWFSDNFGHVSGLYNENGVEVDITSNLASGTYYLWITTPSTPTTSDTFRVDKIANEIKMLETLNVKASDRYDAVNGVVVTLTEADGLYAGDEVTITIDVSNIDESYWTTGEVFGLTDSVADSGNGVLVATVGGADKDNYMIHWPGITVTVACEPDMRGICTGCGEYLGMTEYSVNEWIMGVDIAAGETIYLRVELDTEDNPKYNLQFQTAAGINYIEMPSNLDVKAYLDPESAAGDTPIALNLTAKEFATSQYMYIVITATNHAIYNIQIEETF